MGPVLGTVLACRAEVHAIPPGPVHATGDDVCALALRVDLLVQDDAGLPLPGVELWRVDRRHIQGKALRLGLTDPDGRLSAPDCYMGSLEYRFWRPAEEPIALQFLVLKEGYGYEPVRLMPPTDDVLRDGATLGVPPGRPFEWSEITPRPAGSARPAYRIPLTIALRAARE